MRAAPPSRKPPASGSEPPSPPVIPPLFLIIPAAHDVVRPCSALFGFGRIWSGLFGSVRGVRGRSRAAPYLVGAILRGRVWSVLVRFVRLCSGCSGPVGGCSLSGRRDSAWSGLVGFGQVCSALFGVFGAGRGLLPIWSGRFCVVGAGRFWSDLFGSVRGVLLRLGERRAGIGRSLVLLRRSDGITMRAGWGASLPRPRSVIAALRRGNLAECCTDVCAPRFVAPNLIWGPYGGRWRHSAPSRLRTALAGHSGPLALRTGLGLGPKSSLGRRILGAGAGGRSGPIPARGRGDFAWSGLVGFGQICSGLVGVCCCGWVSGGLASAGPLCCCGGATVSRCGREAARHRGAR